MNLSDIYAATLPIVATQNLIMGVTLLLTYRKKQIEKIQYSTGGQLMGIAMLILAIVNYAESFLPFNFIHPETSTIVVCTASIQLFLFLYAYIALLNPGIITKKRIACEIFFILLFTVPPLFISPISQPDLFYPLFYLSTVYYFVKYIICIVVYKKQFRKVQTDLLNYYSDAKKDMPNWIQTTFYMVLAIGAVSILMPFCDYGILILYHSFLFFAYYYVFYKVLHYKPLFDTDMPSLVITEKQDDAQTVSDREEILFSFDKWIAERHYVTPGITIEDVASQLKTNRTTLSLYLNSELKVTFYEWISKIRIEDARKLIEGNPSLPIPEVAVRVGIENRSNFDKLFKRIVGVSPATYRLQFVQNKLK